MQDRLSGARPARRAAQSCQKTTDRAQQWLNGHRDDVPLRDEKAERRRRRMARAERARIAKRNASVRKRNGLSGSPK